MIDNGLQTDAIVIEDRMVRSKFVRLDTLSTILRFSVQVIEPCVAGWGYSLGHTWPLSAAA